MSELSENPDSIGGRKSKHHIAGQDRLVRIFFSAYQSKKEQEVNTKDGKQYWVDVMLFARLLLQNKKKLPVAALEVDTYVYGTQKKKSPRHIRNRDTSIMQTLNIPVVRIDVDALKEGRSKTKFYMTDIQIVEYVREAIIQFWHDPDRYMKSFHRG